MDFVKDEFTTDHNGSDKQLAPEAIADKADHARDNLIMKRRNSFVAIQALSKKKESKCNPILNMQNAYVLSTFETVITQNAGPTRGQAMA